MVSFGTKPTIMYTFAHVQSHVSDDCGSMRAVHNWVRAEFDTKGCQDIQEAQCKVSMMCMCVVTMQAIPAAHTYDRVS